MVTRAAAVPRFRLYVTVDTGQTFELSASRTTAEAQHFAAVTVQEGWWHEGLWYPPHRLKDIRTEPMS